MQWMTANDFPVPDTDYAANEIYEEAPVRLVASTAQPTPIYDRTQQQYYEAENDLYFAWQIVNRTTDLGQTTTFASGMRPFNMVHSLLENMAKVQQRQRERAAGVALDETAMHALEVLNRETSLRWEELADQIPMDWPAVCRGISLLAAADMCELGPARVRLSDQGDTILSQWRGR